MCYLTLSINISNTGEELGCHTARQQPTSPGAVLRERTYQEKGKEDIALRQIPRLIGTKQEEEYT